MASTVVRYQLFRVGRVPCKLNNERNEKHQTGAQRCATEKLAQVGLSQLPAKLSIKSFKL